MRAARESGNLGTGGGGGARGSTLVFQVVPDGPAESAGAEPAGGPGASLLPAEGPGPGHDVGAPPPPLGLPGGGPGGPQASEPGSTGGLASTSAGEAGTGVPTT